MQVLFKCSFLFFTEEDVVFFSSNRIHITSLSTLKAFYLIKRRTWYYNFSAFFFTVILYLCEFCMDYDLVIKILSWSCMVVSLLFSFFFKSYSYVLLVQHTNKEKHFIPLTLEKKDEAKSILRFYGKLKQNVI